MTVEDYAKEIHKNSDLFELMKFVKDNREYADIALGMLKECKKTVA